MGQLSVLLHVARKRRKKPYNRISNISSNKRKLFPSLEARLRAPVRLRVPTDRFWLQQVATAAWVVVLLLAALDILPAEQHQRRLALGHQHN